MAPRPTPARYPLLLLPGFPCCKESPSLPAFPQGRMQLALRCGLGRACYSHSLKTDLDKRRT